MCDCGSNCRPPAERGGCARRNRNAVLRSYADVVRDYQKRYQRRAADSLRFYANQKTLADAVRLAVLAQTADGKRQSHQRRISGLRLRRAFTRLKRCNLRRCRSFHALHQMIDDAIRCIPGIGPLAVYDTANRIGIYRGLAPEKVYLHCGTRTGARAMGLGRGRDVLEISELPTAFHRLTADDIENCLCIYKDDLKRISGVS